MASSIRESIKKRRGIEAPKIKYPLRDNYRSNADRNRKKTMVNESIEESIIAGQTLSVLSGIEGNKDSSLVMSNIVGQDDISNIKIREPRMNIKQNKIQRRPVILLCDVPLNRRREIVAKIKQKGGIIADQFDDNVTHLVTDKVTLDCIIGLLKGLWILPIRWVFQGTSFSDEGLYSTRCSDVLNNKKFYFSSSFDSNKESINFKRLMIIVCSQQLLIF